MARTTWQNLTFVDLVDSVSLSCPTEWQKAECALIRIKIKSRDVSVGKTDLSKSIVREWSGYWYLYRDNYQVSNGSIDFKTEQIYFDRWLWTAEIATQQLAQRLPIIEVTQPEENAEELSEFLIFGGEVLAGLVANLNIPIVGDILQFVTDFFADLSSEDLSYLPSPFRPDTLFVWFPVGKVSLDVEFRWLGYSPVAIGAGIAELPIESIQTLPILPQADDPRNPAPQKTFDELAREQGYILESEIPTPPKPRYKIQFNVSPNGGGGTGGARILVFESSSVPTVTITRFNPATNAPLGQYFVSLTSDAGCVVSSPATPSRSPSAQWLVASVIYDGNLLAYSVLYGTFNLSVVPSAQLISLVQCS